MKVRCEFCGKPIPVPDDHPVDWAICPACQLDARTCEAWIGTFDTDGAVACGAPAVGSFSSFNTGELTWACAEHLHLVETPR